VDNINTHHAKKIFNAYGPTETTVQCLVHCTGTAIPKEISGWIDLPIRNTHLYGVPQGAEPDPATSTFPLAKRGGPCELFVGGVGVARGYRNSPKKTAAKILPNTIGQPGRVYRTAIWNTSVRLTHR
jgi:non-ribosomal peptide synthetase component F